MFRDTYQEGFITVFNSIGSKPLAIWHTNIQDGYARRLTDEDINSAAFEMTSTSVSTSYISTPVKSNESLAIKLPFIVLLLKNLNKYFTFEIQILDDSNALRRFRLSNFQSRTRINPFGAQLPLALQPNWNVVQINLSDFTKRAYGTNYIETVRLQIHANIRIRRIYFADRLYEEFEKPKEFQLPFGNHFEGNNKKKGKLSQPPPSPITQGHIFKTEITNDA